MPVGTARIIADLGEIDADPPSPVAFVSSQYPAIVDGERVYFERSVSDPTLAKMVRAATDADELVHLATPVNGLTRQASILLHAHASQMLASNKKAGAKIATFTKARARMEQLAKKLAADPKRIGAAALRTRLEE